MFCSDNESIFKNQGLEEPLCSCVRGLREILTHYSRQLVRLVQGWWFLLFDLARECCWSIIGLGCIFSIRYYLLDKYSIYAEVHLRSDCPLLSPLFAITAYVNVLERINLDSSKKKTQHPRDRCCADRKPSEPRRRSIVVATVAVVDLLLLLLILLFIYILSSFVSKQNFRTSPRSSTPWRTKKRVAIVNWARDYVHFVQRKEGLHPTMSAIFPDELLQVAPSYDFSRPIPPPTDTSAPVWSPSAPPTSNLLYSLTHYHLLLTKPAHLSASTNTLHSLRWRFNELHVSDDIKRSRTASTKQQLVTTKATSFFATHSTRSIPFAISTTALHRSSTPATTSLFCFSCVRCYERTQFVRCPEHVRR